jgi:hypothetical protein
MTGLMKWGGFGAAAWFLSAAPAMAQAPQHEVIAGIKSTRPIHGQPYELAGRRIVFTNWYYIQPGDLDWRNAEGKSVYVHGNEDLYAARHVGISAPHGIRLQVEKPHLMGAVERPHRMLTQEGDLYKGWTDSDYYESRDALHWERKAHLQFDAGVTDGTYQVFVDPTAPPEKRYKSIWTGSITRKQFDEYRARRPDDWEPHALLGLGEKDQIDCLRGGTSPDGIHWTTLPDPLVVEYCDTWNTAYYDRALGEYVLYTRHWSVGPRTERLPPDIRNSWTGVGRRAIGRTSSRDFAAFKPSEMILEPTPDMLPSEQLYTNCRTSIPGAPDQHLMFPTVWNGSIDDTTRVLAASSHDGKLWHWLPGGEILKTGAFGEWNGGCIWATPNLLELPNGDWALPYLAHNIPHKYPRGKMVGTTSYAVWPKGRLVSVGSDGEGEFTMITVMAPGKVLKVNALTLRTGSVRIEALGIKGRSMDECAPLVGDQHWTRVRWKDADDLGINPGQPVTLRVHLKQARLFGLEFE